MGFLDNLLSKGAKKILNNVIDSATERISDTFDINSKSYAGTNSDSKITTRLENVFSSYYPAYEVRKNISPTTLGGTGKFRPYTYGLYLNNTPMAFIMVTDHNKEILREFRWSKEFAENQGIPFVNFLTQFPNTEEYIKNRLANIIR